jgi:hypothetical protein
MMKFADDNTQASKDALIGEFATALEAEYSDMPVQLG